MRNFIKHFRRDRDGVWTCVSPVDLETVQGRVQVIPGTSFPPDTLFMGVDLVGMLDDDFSKANCHASPLVSQPPQDPIGAGLR